MIFVQLIRPISLTHIKGNIIGWEDVKPWLSIDIRPKRHIESSSVTNTCNCQNFVNHSLNHSFATFNGGFVAFICLNVSDLNKLRCLAYFA